MLQNDALPLRRRQEGVAAPGSVSDSGPAALGSPTSRQTRAAGQPTDRVGTPDLGTTVPPRPPMPCPATRGLQQGPERNIISVAGISRRTKSQPRFAPRPRCRCRRPARAPFIVSSSAAVVSGWQSIKLRFGDRLGRRAASSSPQPGLASMPWNFCCSIWKTKRPCRALSQVNGATMPS
jgi:hypothetical protein